jgi:hypothetical protein
MFTSTGRAYAQEIFAVALAVGTLLGLAYIVPA